MSQILNIVYGNRLLIVSGLLLNNHIHHSFAGCLSSTTPKSRTGKFTVDKILSSSISGCKILIGFSTEIKLLCLNDLNRPGGLRWLLTDLAMPYIILVSYSLKCIAMFVTKCYRNGAGLVTLLYN